MATTGTRERYGRNFHNTESNYGLPNDAEEYARLNIQHQALKLMIGTNCLAPLEELAAGPKAILDLCCGSGQWVIEMAEEFPIAEVIGFDISAPLFSTNVVVPTNCKFLTGDVKKPLPFPADSFDLVHMRVAPSVSNRKNIIREIGRILRPNGYIAFAEPDESYSQTTRDNDSRGDCPAMIEMDRCLASLPHSSEKTESDAEDDHKFLAKNGWSLGPILKDMITLSKDAEGRNIFCDVEERVISLPQGPWPTDAHLRHIGELMIQNQVGMMDAFRPALLEHNVLSAEGFDARRQAEVAELNNDKLELMAPYWFAWGRKNPKSV